MERDIILLLNVGKEMMISRVQRPDYSNNNMKLLLKVTKWVQSKDYLLLNLIGRKERRVVDQQET